MRINPLDIMNKTLHRPYDDDWEGLWWILWHSERRSIWLGGIIAAVLVALVSCG